MRRQPPPAIVRTVMRARHALHRAGDRLMPAEWALLGHTFGLASTHVVAVMAELGVADRLSMPRTAEDLAKELAVDADALHRVLRCAAVLGVVRLDRRGRFALTRVGRRLRSDDPASLREWARYMGMDSTARAWGALGHAVKTGEPAFPHVHGTSVWSWYAEHPDEEERFAGAMRQVTELVAPAIVEGYPWPEAGTVCDVGGGVGTLLVAVLAARPGLRGVLVDGAGPLEQSDAFLRSRGVRERVERSVGDIFGEVNARADLFVLKDVLHDWDDERCLTILATVRATMRPGERLALIETLQEPNVPGYMASVSDVQMLTQCDGGRQRSEAELHALLRATGYAPGRTHPTAGPSVLDADAV